jgi:hypothetical protein
MSCDAMANASRNKPNTREDVINDLITTNVNPGFFGSFNVIL